MRVPCGNHVGATCGLRCCGGISAIFTCQTIRLWYARQLSLYLYFYPKGWDSQSPWDVPQESLASQGRCREPGRQPPGVLHISRILEGSLRVPSEGALRAPWGRLEGAPWDYLRITLRLPLTITRCPSDFPLIMAFKIVRKQSGYPPVPLRPSTGCLRPVCSRTVSWKRRENWEQVAQHNGARTTSKKSPGALENRRAPYGHRTELAKITVFTRRMGPLMDMWQLH